MCHGATGAPAIGGVPDLRRGLAMMRPDRQLLATLRNGRTTMPGYLGRLSDRDLLDVIAYMRTLT
ncbi:MAG: cytochrome c [Burkholderiales bacterium]|nr:cytochrome c [Burkholderiales bacterium]